MRVLWWLYCLARESRLVSYEMVYCLEKKAGTSELYVVILCVLISFILYVGSMMWSGTLYSFCTSLHNRTTDFMYMRQKVSKQFSLKDNVGLDVYGIYVAYKVQHRKNKSCINLTQTQVNQTIGSIKIEFISQCLGAYPRHTINKFTAIIRDISGFQFTLQNAALKESL